jgi:hypothetical protein
MKQHHRDDLALQIIRNKKLKDDPGMISSWLNRRRFVCSAPFLLNSQSVYEEVIANEVSRRGSPIASELRKCHRRHGRNVRFVLLSSTKESVWSCGLSKSDAVDGASALGFDLYGIALTKVYKKLFSGGLRSVDWGLDTLLNERFFGDFGRKTVLVVSDSICGYLQAVLGGTVIAEGGATYDVLAEILRQCEPSEFEFLVVHCGVNVAKRSEVFQQWSWEALEPELMRFAMSNVEVLVSGPIPHPEARGVVEHTEMIQRQLAHSPIKYVNWNLISNCFVDDDGNQDLQYFCLSDDFHLSHRGIYKLWEEWCRHLKPLRQLRIKLSRRPYRQHMISGGVFRAL